MTKDVTLGKAAVALGLIWGVIVVYVVVGQLPGAALQLPGQRGVSEVARLVAPQGWAFFTKTARDERHTWWRPDADGTWRPTSLGPHAEPRNLWGLDRISRAEGVETGLVLEAVSGHHWRDCPDGAVDGCLSRSATAVHVRNPSPGPVLCGTLGLSRQKPLPWAWAGAADRTRMPATVVRVEVTCSRD
ncbi:SdpA family antimicrobial peptide system protein [Sphaerisporangium dianthi]|uniref:SdpA family antimicrobial peptide system protein n=1 Tax=Sphaerisporangium dianthi TaxID=1436120 RepID=A0ABV9CSE7_9ACTN